MLHHLNVKNLSVILCLVGWKYCFSLKHVIITFQFDRDVASSKSSCPHSTETPKSASHSPRASNQRKL